MKKRVGKYKNKIIVEGDKNEFKPHEVSIKELAGTDNMGGGGDSNGIGIEYYKVIGMPTDMPLFTYFLNIIFVSSAFISYSQSDAIWIGPAACIHQLDRAIDYDILAIGFINKKLISVVNGNIFIMEGTLQERADMYINAVDGPKLNINDYLEPITEEEFYNIKPE